MQLVKEMITLLVVCLLDYNYFKKYYKVIAIDLSKQQALDADPKAIQQIIRTIVLLAKCKLNSREVLISKTLIG